jgi:hypothetical protein
MREIRVVLALALVVAMTLITTGCVSWIKGTLDAGDFDEQIEAIEGLKGLDVTRCTLRAAADASRANLVKEVLPGGLGQSALFDRMSSVYAQVLEVRGGAVDDVSARDVERFAESFVDALGASGQLSDEARGDVWRTFKKYYQAYIRGEFVDRSGTQLSRPELKKTVGNDTLSGALVILLEAASDEVLETPVLYTIGDDGKPLYFPHEADLEPTVASVWKELDERKGLVRLIGENEETQCGVTESEARAIGYVASLAGDRSSIVSGMVLESFGDVQVAFGVGGHFSVGDNETLATLVKTFFEVVSRRGTERLFFDFFDAYHVPMLPEEAADAGVLAERSESPLAPRQDDARIQAFLSGF